MKMQTLLLLLFAFSMVRCQALAGVLSIVTDQPGAAKANEFKALIEKSNCFRDLKNFEIKVRVVESEKLKSCQPHSLVFRSVACDASVFSRMASEDNADRVLVIKDSPQYGGSGQFGGIGAVMTTASPPQVGLHELLHVVGFWDEYAYVSEAEANVYCARPLRAPNLTIFRHFPPYDSDASARQKHASEIPWFDRITAPTITTLPNLGTSEPNRIGLYPAATCSKATTGYSGWRPGDDPKPNIMSTSAPEATIPETFCPAIHQAFLSAMPISPFVVSPGPGPQPSGRD